MLFLLFELGADRYALDAGQVLEVLPLVRIKAIPLASPGVAGVFNFRGAPVPAIDLTALTTGHPAPARLSTRLILVRYPDSQGVDRVLGLIAERATDTLRREPSDFTATGITDAGAPYLGPVTTDARGVIQRIDVRTLLTPAVRDILFTQAGGS